MTARRSPAPAPSTAGKRLALIVDDEASIRRLTRSMFEGWGFEVIEASSGQEALAQFDRMGGKLAIVLMDVTMPGGGGIEAARAMREQNSTVPILLSSGYADTLPPDALDIGFLPKPYRPVELKARVEALCEGGSVDS